MYTAKSIGFDGEAPGLMLATIIMHVLVNASTPAGFWCLGFLKALASSSQWTEENGKAPLHTAKDEKERQWGNWWRYHSEPIDKYPPDHLRKNIAVVEFTRAYYDKHHVAWFLRYHKFMDGLLHTTQDVDWISRQRTEFQNNLRSSSPGVKYLGYATWKGPYLEPMNEMGWCQPE